MADYEQVCSPGLCTEGTKCDDCCPPPLPNSHLVSCDCECVYDALFMLWLCWNEYETLKCQYDCDAGYEWDGEACVLAEEKKPLIKGDGLVWLVMQH